MRAARAALAEARSVDEVKDIRDKSEAMRAYARMAKDTQLEMDATELRLRAERRLGIMLTEQKRTVGLNRGGWQSCGTDEEPQDRVPTLSEVGIDKKLSARSQKIGGIGEAPPMFFTRLANCRQELESQASRIHRQRLQPAALESEDAQTSSANIAAVRCCSDEFDFALRGALTSSAMTLRAVARRPSALLSIPVSCKLRHRDQSFCCPRSCEEAVSI
jgi:hypothetical protein